MFHLKELSREEGLRLVEEAREKAWKDQKARESDSFKKGLKQGIEQGMDKGMKQGMEQGMEKGITQGMGKGIEKGKKELIMSMLEKGMEVSLLSEFTGLSEEEINKLQKLLS